MQVAGRPSWRFGYGNGQCSDLHEALFARDSAGLVVLPSPDVPPPLAAEWLAGELPPGLVMLTPAELAAAADQWLTWWRQLLAVKVSLVDSRPGPGADMAATLSWAESLYRSAAFDPPEFDSLVSMPELQAVVRATQPSHPRVPDRSGSFDYQLICGIAEQTAADFGTPIDAIDGTAHVLDVQGSWWHVAGPGCVLCSPAATADPAIAAQLLRAVFASRLGGPTPD
ncbi:MAG: hypothetical protein ACRDOK_06665 [Streptosporangiaceae bacterium]